MSSAVESGFEGNEELGSKARSPRSAPRPIVAIVGRPNVGKSTLFNRLTGQRRAIIEDLPGTTRDRLYGDVEWAGRTFTLIDTGGLELQPSDAIMTAVAAQVRVAVEEADVILLATDTVDGVTAADHEIADQLRRGIAGDGSARKGNHDRASQGRTAPVPGAAITAKTRKRGVRPIIVVAGKADNEARRATAGEFWSLGFDEVIAISAYHGANVGDLLDAVIAHLAPAVGGEEAEDTRLRVALVGRPNVGKSSLLNRLVGEQRAVVSDVPGTTRDAIDSVVTHNGDEIVLIDTAGIRRRGKVEPGIEKYSVLRSFRAISRADVALLLIDAVEGVTAQDVHIAGEIDRQGRGCVVVVNKWDAVPEKDAHTSGRYLDELARELNFMRWAPVVFISALTGQRARKVLDEAIEVQATRQERVPTAKLNEFLERAIEANPPKGFRGRIARFRFATQADAVPPTFVFFVNDPMAVHFTYQRYLENALRDLYPFRGTPVRMRFRPRAESDENSTPTATGSKRGKGSKPVKPAKPAKPSAPSERTGVAARKTTTTTLEEYGGT
jgi:GTP-binding protein